MRRRNAGTARATYLKWLQLLEGLYGRGRFGCSWAAEIAAIQAGKPVVVQHGYEIDLLPPFSGPFCLESDARSRRLSLSTATRTPLSAPWSVIAVLGGRLLGRRPPASRRDPGV